MWRKIFISTIWITLGVACAALMIAAIKKNEYKMCSDVQVTITKANKNIFLNRRYVEQILKDNHIIRGKEIYPIDLKQTEEQLEKNPWIKNAELFFDNNRVFYAKIEERTPIARVFTLQGASFYIDSNSNRLPLSDEETARVPVFTSFPSDKKILSKPDSLVLQDVTKIAKFIQQDSFWLAQVSQVDILPNRTYEMLPLLGNQVVEIGDANDLVDKFLKLFVFYQKVWSKVGFEKYERLNIQYKDQVIATKKGTSKPFADSGKTMEAFNKSVIAMNEETKNTIAAPLEETELNKTEIYAVKNQPEEASHKDDVQHKSKAVTKKRN